MGTFEINFLSLSRVVLAGILIWLGLLGLLGSGGFTTVSTIPILDFGNPAMFICIAQIILGAALFVQGLTVVGEIISAVYLLLIAYNFVLKFDSRFDPNFPNLSELGLFSLLEIALVVGAFTMLYIYGRRRI